jgi:SAM-dependent methyltransferase
VTVSDLHPSTRGFAAADVYERGRPDYPRAAIDRIVERLDLRPGRMVLDLAAGTGKLTRLLLPSGANVIAVEPVHEMRAELERRVPAVAVMAGVAERIPLSDAYVDGVTVGQAFHWFKVDEALHEIHRVLKPRGSVALVWNAGDERNPIQAGIAGIVDPLSGDTPRRKHRDWRTLLADSGLFEDCERALFENVQETDEQGVVERVLSISFIANAAQSVRNEVEADIRALVRDAEPPIRLTYMTEVYLGTKAT